MFTNLLSNIYYILPEIIILLGIFISTLTGVFSSKKSLHNVIIIIISTFIISLCFILSINLNQGLLLQNVMILSKFTQFSKSVILLCNIIIIIIFGYFDNQFVNNKIRVFEVPIIIALSTLGIFVIISSNSLLMFYLGLELLNLGLYILIAINKNIAQSIEASLKYFTLGSISSGVFLFGTSLVYGASGSIAFDDIKLVCITQGCINNSNIILFIGISLIIVTLMFKLSLFPFHSWIPDVYEGSPNYSTIFLASSVKFTLVIITIRLILEPFSMFIPFIQEILILISVLSLLFGNIIALVQTNIKRIIAYSTISNMGFVLIGIVKIYNEECLTYIIFYSITYITQIILLFALLTILKNKLNFNDNLNNLVGLSRSNPFICFAFVVTMFSMLGIPPFTGFFAKFYIFTILIKVQSYYLLIIILITTVISAFYYLNIIRKMYFDKIKNNTSVLKFQLNLIEITIITLGIILNIFYILCPSYILEVIKNHI